MQVLTGPPRLTIARIAWGMSHRVDRVGRAAGGGAVHLCVLSAWFDVPPMARRPRPAGRLTPKGQIPSPGHMKSINRWLENVETHPVPGNRNPRLARRYADVAREQRQSQMRRLGKFDECALIALSRHGSIVKLAVSKISAGRRWLRIEYAGEDLPFCEGPFGKACKMRSRVVQRTLIVESADDQGSLKDGFSAEACSARFAARKSIAAF